MINDAAAKEKNNQEITLECRAEHGGPHYTGPDEKSGWSSTIGTYLWERYCFGQYARPTYKFQLTCSKLSFEWGKKLVTLNELVKENKTGQIQSFYTEFVETKENNDNKIAQRLKHLKPLFVIGSCIRKSFPLPYLYYLNCYNDYKALKKLEIYEGFDPGLYDYIYKTYELYRKITFFCACACGCVPALVLFLNYRFRIF